MSDTPKKTAATISAPTLKVEASGPAEKPRTPEQDAKDALEGRKATEKAKADANQALVDAGKVEPLTPITSYETAREALGTPTEDTPQGA